MIGVVPNNINLVTPNNSTPKLNNDIFKSGGFANVFRFVKTPGDNLTVIKWISIRESQAARDFALKEIELANTHNHRASIHYFDSQNEPKPEGWKPISKHCVDQLNESRNQLTSIIKHVADLKDYKANIDYVNVFIVTKCYPVTLKEFLKSNQDRNTLPLTVKKRWLKSLAEVVAHFHDRNVFRTYLNTDDIYVVIDNNMPALKVDCLGNALSLHGMGIIKDTSIDLVTLASIGVDLFLTIRNEQFKGPIFELFRLDPKCASELFFNLKEEQDFFQYLFDKSSTARAISLHPYLDCVVENPENIGEPRIFQCSPLSEEEMETSEDYIHALGKDFPDVVRGTFMKLRQFSLLTSSFVFERQMENHEHGEQLLVRCRKNGKLFRVRRIAVPFLKSIGLVKGGTLNQINLSHVINISKSWIENQSKEWDTLYKLYNLTIQNMNNIKKELKCLLRSDGANQLENKKMEPVGLLNTPFSEIIITMKCSGMTLKQWLDIYSEKEHREPNELKKWIKQLGEALSHIHAVNSCHRNFNSSNVFLLAQTDPNSYPPLIVGDYGFTRSLKDGNFGENSEQSDYNNNFPTCASSYFYPPPELARRNLYNSKSDIYALGVISTEILFPIDHTFTMDYHYYRNTSLKSIIAMHIFDLRKLFVLYLTQVDPEDRPTIQQVLIHQFLRLSY